MNVISRDVINEIVIKNSKFICILKYVSSLEDVNYVLDECRNKYKDATHVTYAWRLFDRQKYNDDGEPGGTAGAPIMEVLLKNDIVNVIAVVVRYFGGVKLGAGGLIRAYSRSVRDALADTCLNKYVKYNYYELLSSYDDLKLLNALTSGLLVIDKVFGENIVYKIKVKDDDDNIVELFNGSSISVKCIN